MGQRIRSTCWVSLACCAAAAMFLPGCSPAEDFWRDAKPGQKKVLVTFPPLYCFAKNVAGPDAYVLCLLTTQGTHGYSPGHDDGLKVKYADIIFANGLELDGFVKALKKSSRNQRAEIVEVAKAIDDHFLIHHEEHEGHEHDKDGDCCHGDHDPHVWLHPEFAGHMVDRIAEKLAALDPDHAQGYKDRATAYKVELQSLQTDGAAALKGKKNRKLITQHRSLGYFGRAFDLEIVDSIHVRAGLEPDSQQMATLVKLCREEKVAAICVEPQYPKKDAEALLSQLARSKTAVQLVEVDPMETAPGSPNPDPGFYLQRMRQNLDNLKKALP